MWTDFEVYRLNHLRAAGLSWECIGKILKRSPVACRLKYTRTQPKKKDPLLEYARAHRRGGFLAYIKRVLCS